MPRLYLVIVLSITCLLGGAIFLFLSASHTLVSISQSSISRKQLDQRVDQLSAASTFSNKDDSKRVLSSTALTELIEERWTDLEAARQKITLNRAAAKQRFTIDSTSASSKGTPKSLLWQRARQTTLFSQLAARQKVSDREIDKQLKLIEENQPRIGQIPQTVLRNLDTIFTNTREESTSAKAALKSGMTFERAVDKFASGDDQFSGRLLSVAPGSLGVEAEEKLRVSLPGTLIGPVPFSNGWIIISYRSRASQESSERSQGQAKTNRRAAILLAQQQSLREVLANHWRKYTVCDKGANSPLCGRFR